jgi:hypothetical protein
MTVFGMENRTGSGEMGIWIGVGMQIGLGVFNKIEA